MLDEHLAPIIATVNEQIARLYRALRSLPTNSDFDPVSYRRSAIEPQEQDSFRDPIDVLIDAARDCIEHPLANDARLADRTSMHGSTTGNRSSDVGGESAYSEPSAGS
jgi:hypothetical protein